MELHTLGTHNVVLASATLISSFITKISGSEVVGTVTVLVGIATLISVVQKVYYNWELRRDRKRKENKKHNNQNP